MNKEPRRPVQEQRGPTVAVAGGRIGAVATRGH